MNELGVIQQNILESEEILRNHIVQCNATNKQQIELQQKLAALESDKKANSEAIKSLEAQRTELNDKLVVATQNAADQATSLTEQVSKLTGIVREVSEKLKALAKLTTDDESGAASKVDV
jgi:chromosome segregation ATPase